MENDRNDRVLREGGIGLSQTQPGGVNNLGMHVFPTLLAGGGGGIISGGYAGDKAVDGFAGGETHGGYAQGA